ncbi:GDP-L-fucose synthase [Kiloniella sp.]|uniref:GDP-L-fucose synthase n=1 Tax=Kiloniella sp. TaxID=1938587 RepID=UPI003B02D4EE
METEEKIYVAGHRGMVGSAIVRQLLKQGHSSQNIVTATHSDLDLTDQAAVRSFFKENKPRQVYLAAAKVGGIYANNTYPADFIYNNLMIQANIIDAAFKNNVKKLLFLGSSCIYPKHAENPISESALLTGTLEPTNEPYAIAKIAGIKLCESYNRQYGQSHDIDYRSVMPTNLYGPGDNYHPDNSHVIPGLIRRFHEAKTNNTPEVKVWGSGKPRREFLFVDDMASASVHVMNLAKSTYDQHTQSTLSHINVGSGNDITIKELAHKIAEVTGYSGRIEFDHSKPDGTLRKLMDNSRILNLGWQASVTLEDGLKSSLEDYLK